MKNSLNLVFLLFSILLINACGSTQARYYIDNSSSNTISVELDGKKIDIKSFSLHQDIINVGKHTLKYNGESKDFTVDSDAAFILNPTNAVYIAETVKYARNGSTQAEEENSTKDIINLFNLILHDSLVNVKAENGKNLKELQQFITYEAEWNYLFDENAPKEIEVKNSADVKSKIKLHRKRNFRNYYMRELEQEWAKENDGKYLTKEEFREKLTVTLMILQMSPEEEVPGNVN